MADPRQTVNLTVGEDSHPLRFTHSALVHAEKLTRKTIVELAMLAAAGRYGLAELTALTCAGLEGARRKQGLGGKPWTEASVSDLLDDAGDFDSVADPVLEAFNVALERWFPSEQEPADPPVAAGSGTNSSEPPSEQG